MIDDLLLLLILIINIVLVFGVFIIGFRARARGGYQPTSECSNPTNPPGED